MPVADTCFLIDLMMREPDALALYVAYEERSLPLATTAISALELYKGAYLSLKREENIRKVKAVLGLFECLPLDESVYEAFGAYSASLVQKGTPTGDFDELIAVLALCHDGVLITRDQHFSRIPGLEILSYSRSSGRQGNL